MLFAKLVQRKRDVEDECRMHWIFYHKRRRFAAPKSIAHMVKKIGLRGIDCNDLIEEDIQFLKTQTG